MGRFIGSILLLGVFIAWLVLSYAPVSLPTIAYGRAGQWFAILLAGVLIVFLGIQCWLIAVSARLFRPNSDLDRTEIGAEFRLRRRSEVFWTAIPLVMTVLLAVWSYPTWVSLIGR